MKYHLSISSKILFASFLALDSAQAFAAPKELRGRIEIHVVDGKGGSTEHAILHEKGTGKRYRLRGAGLTRLRSGSEIVARGGLSSAGELDATGFTVLSEATSIASTGVVKNVLLLVVNFSDASLTCTPEQISESVLGPSGSVAALYSEMSFGALSYIGDTTPPLTIAASSTDACDTGYGMPTWRSQADAAARAAGFEPDSYADRLYFFPRNANCGGVAGVGTVGSSTPWSVNAGYCYLSDVMAHELGHNLGLKHAGEQGKAEYSDTTDIMGYSGIGLRQVNAFHRIQLGFLPSTHVVTPASSGIFKIAPLELDPATVSDPIALKLPNVRAGNFYYLFNRQQIGFDARLSSSDSGGLAIGHASATSASCSTSGGSPDTCLIRRSLLDGETFTDAESGFSVTQLSHGLDGVTVALNFDCTRSAPLLSVTPSSQLLAPGGQAVYSILVTNMDSSSCPSSQFDLRADLPMALSGSLSSGFLSLAGGQSGSVILTAVTGADTAEGWYSISLLASDPSDSSRIATGSATLTVEARIPSTPTGLVANQVASWKRVQISLGWNASSDTNGVAYYEIYRDGAWIGQVTDTSITDTVYSIGTYSYQVRAVDTAGNASALSDSLSVLVESIRVHRNWGDTSSTRN